MAASFATPPVSACPVRRHGAACSPTIAYSARFSLRSAAATAPASDRIAHRGHHAGRRRTWRADAVPGHGRCIGPDDRDRGHVGDVAGVSAGARSAAFAVRKQVGAMAAAPVASNASRVTWPM